MTVPSGVPEAVRAGTGTRCPGHHAKSLPRASFGVQGAFVASLLFPLPFRLSRPTARAISLGRGRSLRLAKSEGQGVRPLHPGSLRLAHRCGGGKLASIDQSFAACHSEWCNRQFVGRLARGGFICVPDVFYDRKRTEESSLRSPTERFTSKALHGQSVVRRHSHCVRDCVRSWIFRDRILIGTWAADSDGGPVISFSCDCSVFGCIAVLCSKQPRVL